MDETGEKVGLTSDIADELFHVRPVSVANTADVELINKSVETKFEPEKKKGKKKEAKKKKENKIKPKEGKATPPSESTSSSSPKEKLSESAAEDSEHESEPEPPPKPEPEEEEEQEEEEKTVFEPEPDPEPESESDPVLDLPGYSSVTVADSLAIIDTFTEVKWMMEEIAETFEKVAGRQGQIHRSADHPIHVITTRHPIITSAINELEGSILGFGDEVEALKNKTEPSSVSSPEPAPANPALIETLDLLQETIFTIQARKAKRASKKKAQAAETMRALREISKSLQVLEGKSKFSEGIQANLASAATSVGSAGHLQRSPQGSTGTPIQSTSSTIFPPNTPPPLGSGSMLFQESSISSATKGAEEIGRTTEHHNKSKSNKSKNSEKSEKSSSGGFLKKMSSKLFGKSSESEDKSKKEKSASKSSKKSKSSDGQKTKDSMVIRDSKSSKKSKDKKHSSVSSTDKSHHHKSHHQKSHHHRDSSASSHTADTAAQRRANNQEKLTCLMNMLRSCHWVDGRIDQMWQKLNGPGGGMAGGGCSPQSMGQPFMPPGAGPQGSMYLGAGAGAGPYPRPSSMSSQFPMAPPPPPPMMPMPPLVPMPFPWYPCMPYMAPPPPNYVAVQRPGKKGSSATFFCTRID